MSDSILIIDDSPEIHALIRVRLGKEPVTLHSAFDGASGLETARRLRPRLILLDVEMPDQDGFAVCAQLKEDPETMEIPVIFLTGSAMTQDKIRGLELGATDYITKPFDPAELRARVRSTLRTCRLMDLLARKAMIDGLTGLWNRAYLDARLVNEMAATRRSGAPLTCIMADVDHFKSINDTYGHSVGDDILRRVATVLTENCRPSDIVCRYGGEEFTILLPATDVQEAAEVAERLRVKIEQLHFTCGEVPRPVTCSFGIAKLGVRVPPSIFELADEALYCAKTSGRNRTRIHEASSGALEAVEELVAIAD